MPTRHDAQHAVVPPYTQTWARPFLGRDRGAMWICGGPSLFQPHNNCRRNLSRFSPPCAGNTWAALWDAPRPGCNDWAQSAEDLRFQQKRLATCKRKQGSRRPKSTPRTISATSTRLGPRRKQHNPLSELQLSVIFLPAQWMCEDCEDASRGLLVDPAFHSPLLGVTQWTDLAWPAAR